MPRKSREKKVETKVFTNEMETAEIQVITSVDTETPNEKLKKIIKKYFIQSGLATTFVGFIITGLTGLQTGTMDMRAFFYGILYSFLFMFFNGILIYLKESN